MEQQPTAQQVTQQPVPIVKKRKTAGRKPKPRSVGVKIQVLPVLIQFD